MYQQPRTELTMSSSLNFSSRSINHVQRMCDVFIVLISLAPRRYLVVRATTDWTGEY